MGISVLGQQIVSGTISDAQSGEPIPGATILIKGTSTGTTTDLDGNYRIQVKDENSVLVFSFIGYLTLEEAVGSRSVIDLPMRADITQLNEVVVTALGIERDSRTLGYSVSNVDGSSLTKAREVNVANSLVGRVAGVNVSSVSGGPGSTSNVVIRGVNSFSGGQPLYVINGVPMDNTTRGTSGQWGGADVGDGIANINPDDIQEITVLKGSTASALYGSRASNGVILITTKSGKNTKGIGVEFNTNYTTERILDFTDWQYEYGQGSDGLKPASQDAILTANGSLSWGAPLDGSSVVQFDGVSRPYSAQEDNLSNFYRNGSTATNTLALSGGNETGSFRFSASDMNNLSVVPGSNLRRNTFNLSISQELSRKLSIKANTNITLDQAKNRPNLSDSPGNSNFGVLFLPTSVNVDDLKPGINPDGSELQSGSNIYQTNPWFAANEWVNDTRRNRNISMVSMKYKLLDWMYLQGRVGRDAYDDRFKNVTPTGTAYLPGGNMIEDAIRSTELNADVLLNASKKLTPDFLLGVTAGGNIRKNDWERLRNTGANFNVPNLYVIQNTNEGRAPIKEVTEKQVNSLYYALDFSFKNFLFLNTSGRQDWFSSLPSDNNSLFYPSVGASFVFSELLNIPVLSFGKIRGSWASTSGDTDPYKTKLYYTIDQSINGQPIGLISNISVPNNQIQPYQFAEFELGADLKFLGERLTLDVAYFNRKTTEEIIDVPSSITTGYTSYTANTGELENKGFEFLIVGTPLRSANLSWEISFNHTFTNPEILTLNGDQQQQQIPGGISRTQNAFVQHVVGKPAAQIMAFDYLRDPSGNIVYDAAGLPRQGELQAHGSGFHRMYGGVNNEFIIKGVNIGFLIDYKFGGHIFSATNVYATTFGLHKMTLEGRGSDIIGEGVVDTNTDPSADPVYAPNTTGVTAQQYYSAVASRISSEFVYDASFVKLRQVVIGYTLPSSLYEGIGIQSVNLSFVARNLAVLMKRTDNIDPESNYNNTVAQGLELAGVPSTRSFGFNLNVKF